MNKETAWGKIGFLFALSGVAGAMAATLVSIGTVDDGTISIETADGKKLELRGSGNELIKSLSLEPTLTVKVNVFNLESITPFWNTTTTGEGDAAKTVVKSLVNSKMYSIAFQSEVGGSESFEAPYCSVSAKPSFTEDKGWVSQMTFQLIKNDAGELFQIGTVPTV